MVHPLPSCLWRFTSRLYATASCRIFQRLPRYADHLVIALLHLAQINILNRVVRLGHFPLAAGTVDDSAFHGGNNGLLVGDVSFYFIQRLSQQQTGVKTLDSVDVGLGLIRPGV